MLLCRLWAALPEQDGSADNLSRLAYLYLSCWFKVTVIKSITQWHFSFCWGTSLYYPLQQHSGPNASNLNPAKPSDSWIGLHGLAPSTGPQRELMCTSKLIWIPELPCTDCFPPTVEADTILQQALKLHSDCNVYYSSWCRLRRTRPNASSSHSQTFFQCTLPWSLCTYTLCKTYVESTVWHHCI